MNRHSCFLLGTLNQFPEITCLHKYRTPQETDNPAISPPSPRASPTWTRGGMVGGRRGLTVEANAAASSSALGAYHVWRCFLDALSRGWGTQSHCPQLWVMEKKQHSKACFHTWVPRELLHNSLVSQVHFLESVIMGKSPVFSENSVFSLHTYLLPLESCQTTLCKTCLQTLLWVTHSYVSWKNWANGQELGLARVPRSWTIWPGRSQCTETFLYSLQGGLRTLQNSLTWHLKKPPFTLPVKMRTELLHPSVDSSAPTSCSPRTRQELGQVLGIWDRQDQCSHVRNIPLESYD